MQVKYQFEKLNICEWWLDRGFYILPVQPNSKHLQKGFGEYQRKLSDLGMCQIFFDKPSSRQNPNIAVVAFHAAILDFDRPDVYDRWAMENPTIARTYSERTPRGGFHVFANCDYPVGVKLIQGVELKRVCVVSPSVLDGVQYERGSGEILNVDANDLFRGLTVAGSPTVHRLQTDLKNNIPSSDSLIGKIKQKYDLASMFLQYLPDLKIAKHHRFISICCPWHDDARPSMFIDQELGFYRCFACGERGDVINAVARFEGIDNRAAIRKLAAGLGGR